MRNAKANDSWRHVYKRLYINTIDEINMNGLLGMNTVTLAHGVFAICGLNGAGKSTIISAIKDIIGLPKSEQDKKKLGSHELSAKIRVNSIITTCRNVSEQRATDLGIMFELIEYIDYEKATKSVEFLYSQENLDELIEQNEEHAFIEDELHELTFLVGKHYEAASVVEINDIEELGTIPYFKVETDTIVYDSTGMGVGEHFLFYIYWKLNQAMRNSIVIIEEPETFIGIASQQHLMNHIAETIACKGITVILSTHSPFILHHIPNDHIRIISRYLNMPSIIVPSVEVPAITYLGGEIRKMGTIFVEDDVAKSFLLCLLAEHSYILKSFTIESVGGESEITKRLQFPFSQSINYKFIGVYDADMRDSVNACELKLEWPYLFLPGTENIEYTFFTFLRSSSENIQLFGERVHKAHDVIVAILAKICGDDYHDWLINFARDLALDKLFVIRSLFDLWRQSNNQIIDLFFEELETIIG